MNVSALLISRDSAVLRPRLPTVLGSVPRRRCSNGGDLRWSLPAAPHRSRCMPLLAEPDRAARIPWSKTYVFFGDERFVPPGDHRSNYGMARRTLLSRVPVVAQQVFPVPTQARCAADAAARYAAELARSLRRRYPALRISPFRPGVAGIGGRWPHGLAISRCAALLQVEDAWVTWSRPGSVPPPVDRITLTYPVFNAARRVAFWAAGASKVAAVATSSKDRSAATNVLRRAFGRRMARSLG